MAAAMVVEGSQASKNEGDKMQLDCLMEKLRSKNRRQKTAIEAIKIFHTVSNDRKSGFDLHLLHAQLNSLRSSINVGKTSYTLDRLEAVATQCGLKFFSDVNKGEAVCSCDIFSFKFSVNENGIIEDVFITVNSDARPCPELLKSLKGGDYDELKRHIEGLNSINEISSDKKIKNKIIVALQSLEADLNSLSVYQNNFSSIQSYVHRSPLGILVPRIGGLPMKLTYFVGPYDLLCKQSKSMIPMTLEAIIENNVGHSLTVGIEKSSHNNKIQTSTLMLANNTSDGKSLPVFAALGNSNSSTLPARFVVNLKEPVVLSWSVINTIQVTTGIKIAEQNLLKPVVSLLVEQLQCNNTDNNKQQQEGSALIVMPSKGKHLCFKNPINHNMVGCVVDRIAFTHPTHLPTIVLQLRQQILFNTLLCSCLRSLTILSPSNMKNLTTRDMQFEVVPLSLQLITVTFQHPVKDSLLTIMLEPNDSINVTCKLTGEHVDMVVPNEYVTRVVQRCLSIPIVIRSIFKKSPHLLVKTCDPSLLPPLGLSRQTSCLVPPPYGSSASKKYLASKSLDSTVDNVKHEARSSIKISVPKLLANLTAPMKVEDDVVVKLEPGLNQSNEANGLNASNMSLGPSYMMSSAAAVGQHHDLKIKKEIYSRINENDVEIIEKPHNMNESTFGGRNPSAGAFPRADKVSSNPMLASLLDQSSGTSNPGAANAPGMMGANVAGVAGTGGGGGKQRKRPAGGEWGVGNNGVRNPKRPKTGANVMSEEYYHHHQLQQQMSRNQLTGGMDGGGKGGGTMGQGAVKLNQGNVSAMKMAEVERLVARQMSDPTSFQNFAAWQNSANCSTGAGMNANNAVGQMMMRQQSSSGAYFDKDGIYPAPPQQQQQQQHMQNRGQLKEQFKAFSFDGNSSGMKQFNSNDGDWEVKIEPVGNDSNAPGMSGKAQNVVEKQPPIKVKFDKRSFTTSGGNDPTRIVSNDSGVGSSPVSSASSEIKRQMSSSLTDLLSDDNNHSNSADSEVGILTSGNAGSNVLPNLPGMMSNSAIVSRCSSSPRLSIKRIGDAKDFTDVRIGMLNAMASGQQVPMKKVKSAGGINKNVEEKRGKRMYPSDSVSMDEAAKQKSKKQKVYEFVDDECIVTASTSPVASQVPPPIKITSAGGKLKIQNPLKSKQMTAGLVGMAAGRASQLSAIMGQKSPKAFGSHHIQGHQRLGKSSAVRPKLVETKTFPDGKMLSRAPQSFMQASPSPVAVANTSPFHTPTSMTQQQYQQVKFKPPQCTTPIGFSAASASINSASPTAMPSSKLNLPSSKTSNATPPTNAKSKSPLSAGEVKPANKKGNLLTVIDTLKKKQHGANGAEGPKNVENTKEYYDAIRLEIIREGNKPSTPTRDQLAASTSAKLANNSKKMAASESLNHQLRTQFQPIAKNQMKTASSKSPSPNTFSSMSVNSAASVLMTGKPPMAVSTVNGSKLNSKSETSLNKPVSYNSGFAAPLSLSSSPPTVPALSSSIHAPQQFAMSRNNVESGDMLRSSSSTPQPLLPSPSFPAPSNSMSGFPSRAGAMNQRPVVSLQMAGGRFHEKSPLKSQLPYSQDVTLKMMKINDISDRLVASRHFLDVVGAVDNPGTSGTGPSSGNGNGNSASTMNPAGGTSASGGGAAVVERLLSPPRSPSPGLTQSVCLTSPSSPPCTAKLLVDDQPHEISCSVLNTVERSSDDFIAPRTKSNNLSGGIISSSSSLSMGRVDASPARALPEIPLHNKSQRVQNKDYDVVTVDDEKCETPDNDLVIDVSPSSSPVESNVKTSSANSDFPPAHQPHLLSMPLNASSSTTYLLDLTNSPPSAVQSDQNVPFSSTSRSSSGWATPNHPVHKSSPPSTGGGQKSQPSSVNSVVCDLDDDLMNEALIM